MDKLSSTFAELKAACDNHDKDREAEISKLNESEKKLTERLDKLNEKKHEIAQKYGNMNAKDDDIVEINAGGKVIAAKRATLTQLEGTRLETLFSGRWDKKLQRDVSGHIFLDINPKCFQAIVDYLNEMMISSKDNPPTLSVVDTENKHILNCQLDLFGLMPTVKLPDSTIITTQKNAILLHDWLKEDGLDGELRLLYRSSRDGRDDLIFHSKCDNIGCTLTIIETTSWLSRIFGGYSNMPWQSVSGGSYGVANNAFLFSLDDEDSPCKLKLKDPNTSHAVYHRSSRGPVFGYEQPGILNDLLVHGKRVTTRFGNSYELGSSPQKLTSGYKHTIKEMEVFQVLGGSPAAVSIEPKKKKARIIPTFNPITIFSAGINNAINVQRACLLRAESELCDLEDRFKDELTFIDQFSGGDDKDLVKLNVSGTVMMTRRHTLCIAENSMLAQQFDDSKWTEQGYNAPRVKQWIPDDVTSWVRKIDGISDEVADFFAKNEITGLELLALNMEGLKMIGIERAGTLCLLLDEIKKLKQTSQDVSTLIEHGPYCFGKILDHLRLKQLHSQGLTDKPALPKVCNSQKDRFEKVVKYYFPGDSSKFILG